MDHMDVNRAILDRAVFSGVRIRAKDLGSYAPFADQFPPSSGQTYSSKFQMHNRYNLIHAHQAHHSLP